MNTKTRLKIIIFGSCIAIFLVFLGPLLWSWISLFEETRSFNTATTTFIGSSGVVVPLGCYPQSAVRSVTVNGTSSTGTKIYQMERSKLVSTNRSLVQNTTKHSTGPYKLQLYETPLYSAKTNGSITYNFSIQLGNTSELAIDDCVLNITIFAGGNGYSEYQKFMNTNDDVRTYNYTCLKWMKPHETEDVFNITYAIPAEEFTYFAVLASGVQQLNYTVIAGLTTYYKTEKLSEANHCTHDECTVTIEDRYPLQTSSQRICIFAELVDDDNSYVAKYIRANIKKADANALTIGFSGAAGFVLCVILVGVLVIACKQRMLDAYRIIREYLQAVQVDAAEGRPLLRNGRLVAPEVINNGNINGQYDAGQPAQNSAVQATNMVLGRGATEQSNDKTTTTTTPYALDGVQGKSICTARVNGIKGY